MYLVRLFLEYTKRSFPLPYSPQIRTFKIKFKSTRLRAKNSLDSANFSFCQQKLSEKFLCYMRLKAILVAWVEGTKWRVLNGK